MGCKPEISKQFKTGDEVMLPAVVVEQIKFGVWVMASSGAQCFVNPDDLVEGHPEKLEAEMKRLADARQLIADRLAGPFTHVTIPVPHWWRFTGGLAEGLGSFITVVGLLILIEWTLRMLRGVGIQ